MERDDSRFGAVVIGAGAAGLGVAAELQRRGVRTVVLEAGECAGGAWRARYDGLRLNSARVVSGVRGVAIPWSAGRFPSRDTYGDYLADCPGRLGLDVRYDVRATRIEHVPEGYLVRASSGELRARAVVVATGYDRVPRLPDWPGRDSFAGRLLHASEYRKASCFAGGDVLVVGTGNSGTEIAAQLASGGAARVRLAMRTPVNIMPRAFLGIPSSVLGVIGRRQPAAFTDRLARVIQRLSFGDLRRHGMPRAPFGVGTELRRKGLGPVVDGGFVAALKAGRIELVGAVDRLDGHDVVLADGRRLCPDAVIAATGYRHGLEDLVGHLGVLDPHGRPLRVDGGPVPGAGGLYFNGYWLPLSGQLPAMRISSRRIASDIASRLRPAHHHATRGLRHFSGRCAAAKAKAVTS